MMKLYKVVDLDCKLPQGAEHHYQGDADVERALAKVRYVPILSNWPQTREPGLFACHDEYNRNLSEQYWAMAEQSHKISPCGELQFDHIWCVGRDGLRADIEHGVVYLGHSVNWGYEYFRWWIENADVGFHGWVNDNAFVADFGQPELQDDNIIMMKSPGYDIYGHWLLDFVPQVNIVKYMDSSGERPLVFDNISKWKQTFLDAAGINNAKAYQCRLSEHRNMRTPTGLKNGFALAQPANMAAWNALRLHFNHLAVRSEGESPEKIFISRRNWGGQRSVENGEAIENLMTELGFKIYHPELHELPEQARYLANARYIVGEDGSGLHAVIFTRPGARLGVLMHPDRTNLWHAGICQSMGHSLGYFPIKYVDGQHRADLDQLRRFVSKLLAD